MHTKHSLHEKKNVLLSLPWDGRSSEYEKMHHQVSVEVSDSVMSKIKCLCRYIASYQNLVLLFLSNEQYFKKKRKRLQTCKWIKRRCCVAKNQKQRNLVDARFAWVERFSNRLTICCHQFVQLGVFCTVPWNAKIQYEPRDVITIYMCVCLCVSVNFRLDVIANRRHNYWNDIYWIHVLNWFFFSSLLFIWFFFKPVFFGTVEPVILRFSYDSAHHSQILSAMWLQFIWKHSNGTRYLNYSNGAFTISINQFGVTYRRLLCVIADW